LLHPVERQIFSKPFNMLARIYHFPKDIKAIKNVNFFVKKLKLLLDKICIDMHEYLLCKFK
jgi:hypothetical protein